MNRFMFVIRAVPLPTNTQCENIAGGIVHIWVISKNDKESAKLQALDYITKYQWKVMNFEHEFEIHESLIPDLGEEELLLYHKACRFGIAADFLAHPKVP